MEMFIGSYFSSWGNKFEKFTRSDITAFWITNSDDFADFWSKKLFFSFLEL